MLTAAHSNLSPPAPPTQHYQYIPYSLPNRRCQTSTVRMIASAVYSRVPYCLKLLQLVESPVDCNMLHASCKLLLVMFDLTHALPPANYSSFGIISATFETIYFDLCPMSTDTSFDDSIRTSFVTASLDFCHMTDAQIFSFGLIGTSVTAASFDICSVPLAHTSIDDLICASLTAT